MVPLCRSGMSYEPRSHAMRWACTLQAYLVGRGVNVLRWKALECGCFLWDGEFPDMSRSGLC